MSPHPVSPGESGRVAGPSLYLPLSLRLFLLLFTVTLAGSALYGYISTRNNSRYGTRVLHDWARRTSMIILHSTRRGMLLNHKEEVSDTIRTVARDPVFESIRIFDKRGTVVFASDPARVGRKVGLNSEACVTCHGGEPPRHHISARERVRIFRAADGNRVLEVINPIENEPDCSSARCHAHPSAQRVLGVLDVRLSLAGPDARLRAMIRQTTLGVLALALAIAAASGWFIYRVVRRPVRTLMEGTRRISAGDLDTRIPVNTRHELGQLAASFNRMAEDLKTARDENRRWSEELERKVMEKTEEVGRAQRQLLHMEKMASLGKLAATVAHEINNPLAGILNYSKLISRTLHQGPPDEEARREILRELELIRQESHRSGEIVRNLLLFARQAGGEFALHHLGEILRRSLMLVRHHVEMAGVELVSSVPEGDDEIVCDANQIEQALVAILVNAVEAMPNGGKLAVRASRKDPGFQVDIADTGVGIPADVLPQIFEPFFSTKNAESGVGLGLAVVYGIVQRHGGRITVDSRPGQGTTFHILLPRRPEQADDARARSGAGGRG